MGIFRHKFGKSGQDQGWLPEGGFSVTNLGNLDRFRHDQGWKAEGGFSVTYLGNLYQIGAEGTYAPSGRSRVVEGPPACLQNERACPAGA